MDTLWAVVTFAFVAAVVLLAIWVFLVAPLAVPRRTARR